MPLVLYLDDDIANLVDFEASLEGSLPFRTATHPIEALRILGKEEIGVLLVGQEKASDPLSEFLEAVRRDHPDTVRLILTDAGLLDQVGDEGQLDVFLTKPWSASGLRLAIQSALERYHTKRRLRELEAKVLAAEQVYALGVAAAELAHEIRNPLGSITSNLRVASDTLSRLQEAKDPEAILALGTEEFSSLSAILEDCLEAAYSLSEITRTIDIASRGSSTSESLDLEEVVRLTFRAIQRDPARREIVAFESSHVPRVRGYRTRLGQVVANLVTNAIQAATSTPDRPPRVLVRLWHESDEVFLEVKDSGPGIEPEALSRIFEPFFTTKGEGGTGLGLAISRRIVEEHGGRIQVLTNVHEGTRFLVILPALPNH